MNLFHTFFDALKFSWKQKPMWKVILLAYVPVSFLSTLVLFPVIIAAVVFYQDTGSWGDNLGCIFFLVLAVIILALNSLIFIISLLVVQVGSSIMMHQSQTDSQEIIENNKITGTFLKRIFLGFVYYLAVLGLPNLIIWLLTVASIVLLIITENVFFDLHFYLLNSNLNANILNICLVFLYAPADFYR